MKNNFLLSVFIFISLSCFSQTAVNFVCNDCSGNSHNLFNELDSGNVIVLCWVMPCDGCIAPSYTTYTEVQNLESTYPDRVHMYICDDEGTLSCSILIDWCLNNNMLKTTRFSDTLIRMTDYGSTGMPKIVVLGGADHHVYFNANDSVDNVALHDSLISALTDNQNISENIKSVVNSKLLPNPADNSSVLLMNIEKSGDYHVELYDYTGNKISDIFKGYLLSGENPVVINTTHLVESNYIVKITGKHGMKESLELQVIH